MWIDFIKFNQDLFFKINNLAADSRFLDNLGIFFAKDLIYLLIGFISFFALFAFWKKRYRGLVVWIIASVVLARGILTPLIRYLFPSARPFVNHSVNLLLVHDASNSFPSGHTAFLFALSSAIFFYAFTKALSSKEKSFFLYLGTLFLALSLLVGLARVFCGVHWPADILEGVIVGIFSGWFPYFLKKKF